MPSNDLISHRYDGLLILEGTMINPNGDPDADGAPRIDPVTGHGLISHAAITRRVRDQVALRHQLPLHIVRDRSIEASTEMAVTAAGLDFSGEVAEPEGKGKGKNKKAKAVTDHKVSITTAVCARFWDTRMFGAVLNVGKLRGGAVSGVVTVTTGRSVYPVTILESAGTRVCETNAEQTSGGKTQEMLRRHHVIHGVYQIPFFVNPHNAQINGATMKDLALFIDGLINAYERRSGMSGAVNIRGLYLFRHESPLGNARSCDLIESINISCPNPLEARKWSDYKVTCDPVPKGVKTFTLADFDNANANVEKMATILGG